MMKLLSRLLLPTLCALAACGGGGHGSSINTDYSGLHVAASREGHLAKAANDEQLLVALRNGVRMSLADEVVIAAADAPSANADPASFSHTTVQVEGVDEADVVKYDGAYIYSLHMEELAHPVDFAVAALPALTRNVLAITRTDSAAATVQPVAELPLSGLQSLQPLMYLQQSNTGATDSAVVLSQFIGNQFIALPAATVVQTDLTTVQVFDVRDPAQASQAWKIEIDGVLRASRKIDDTLYLVSSFRPMLQGLKFPAQTQADKEANELTIQHAGAAQLLPHYRDNGGTDRQLLTPRDCVLPADLRPDESYRDLVVVTAISLSARVVVDFACLGTNVTGVYVSQANLYIGGEAVANNNTPPLFTMLHKFALVEGAIAYQASGRVDGTIDWFNASYFMDEYHDDLRVVTTRQAEASRPNQLSILHQTPQGNLNVQATLPNGARPQPLGAPGDRLTGVRFIGERGYVVTANVVDPLIVLDLHDPAAPFIAGQIEEPGTGMVLQPIASPGAQQLLLSLGYQTDAAGITGGMKLELLDVTDARAPRSLSTRVIGGHGSGSDALYDRHALALLPSADGTRYRLAVPIDVYGGAFPVEPNGGPGSTVAATPVFSYSGMHLFEIDGLGEGQPQLNLVDVIQTASSDPVVLLPRLGFTSRAVLHDDSVFVVGGAMILSRLWSNR